MLILGIVFTIAFVIYTKLVETKIKSNGTAMKILTKIVAPIVILSAAIYTTAYSVVRTALVNDPEMLIDASKKLQEKGVMVFDMSNGNRGSGPNQNYFGSAPFSFKDPSKQDPFIDFQKDPINGIMTDSINSDINEDDEKILNPLIPQKKFGNKSKNKNKKKLGKITAINVLQNNNKSNSEKKDNPWFKKWK